MVSPLIHLTRQSSQKNTGKSPMLLLLHGIGSNEEDLFSLESAFDPRLIIISVRAPLVQSPRAYSWFPVQFTAEGLIADVQAAEKSLQLLAEFVDWAVEEYPVDSRRIICAGFSQGAIMTASLGLTRPEKLKAAILMSGRILPEVLRSPGLQPSYLVIHGTEDNVLPVANGRQSRDLLTSFGLEPSYYEFDMGHTITDESLAVVVSWIDSKVF